MSSEVFILSPTERPSWVQYPKSFGRIVEQGLIHITPWHIMDSKRVLMQLEGLAERYPSRELFPFAYRQDNDDVACWVRGMGEKVFIIHDFASSGFEDEGSFDDVWSWFRSAVEEAASWD